MEIPWDTRPVESHLVDTLARRLTALACAAFGLSALLSIVTLHCLYADGSFQLTEVLKAGDFVAVAKNRDFASFIFQFPVVMAIRLGVTNLHALQIAFGIGCFLPWPVVLLFCRALARRHFWLVMLGCAVGYLNSAFMPVGEYVIAHAFFWPALLAILFVRPLTPQAAAMLAVSALVLVFSYESLLFLGPPLALLSAGRAFGKNEKFWARAVFACCSALLILAAVIALDGIRHPQAPDNLGGFKQGLESMFLFPGWTIGWSFAWLTLLAAACLDASGFTRKFFRPTLALLGAALLVWGLSPIINPNALNTERQYADRSIQLLASLGLLLVAVTLRLCPKWFEARRNYLVGFSAALLLAQSVWQISATWQWRGFVGEWRRVLAAHHGPVSLGETPFGGAAKNGQAVNFDWSWANPNLSIMLAREGRVQSIILSPGQTGWRPFNPLNPAELPKLRQYGVDYGDYIAALKKTGNSPR